MAVTPDRLVLSTGGELVPAMLGPAETEKTLIDKLENWIAEGVQKSASLTGAAADTATEAWAYIRAYTAGIVYRASRESSATLATGESQSYTNDQLQALKDRLAHYQAVFDALLPPSAVATLPMRMSRTREITASW